MENSATGTRTRVARVRAEYPNQLDYSGSWKAFVMRALQIFARDLGVLGNWQDPGSSGDIV